MNFVPSRQPRGPPPDESIQRHEGFARFLKAHSSPRSKRVTAGGKIVPAEPNSPPPTFHTEFIDVVIEEAEARRNQATPAAKQPAKPVIKVTQTTEDPRPEPVLDPRLKIPAHFKIVEIADRGRTAFLSSGDRGGVLKARLNDKGETAFETMHAVDQNHASPQDATVASTTLAPYPAYQQQLVSALVPYQPVVHYFPAPPPPVITVQMVDGTFAMVQLAQTPSNNISIDAALSQLKAQLDECSTSLKRTEKFQALYGDSMEDEKERLAMNQLKRDFVEKQSFLKSQIRQLEHAQALAVESASSNTLTPMDPNTSVGYQMASQALTTYGSNPIYPSAVGGYDLQYSAQAMERNGSEEKSGDNRKSFSPNAPEFIPQMNGIPNKKGILFTNPDKISDELENRSVLQYSAVLATPHSENVSSSTDNSIEVWDRICDEDIPVTPIRFNPAQPANGLKGYLEAEYNEVPDIAEQTGVKPNQSATSESYPASEIPMIGKTLTMADGDAVWRLEDAKDEVAAAYRVLRDAEQSGDSDRKKQAGEAADRSLNKCIALSKKVKEIEARESGTVVSNENAQERTRATETLNIAGESIQARSRHEILLETMMSNHTRQRSVETCERQERVHIKPTTPPSDENKRKGAVPKRPGALYQYKAQSSIAMPSIYAAGNMSKPLARSEEHLANIRGGKTMTESMNGAGRYNTVSGQPSSAYTMRPYLFNGSMVPQAGLPMQSQAWDGIKSLPRHTERPLRHGQEQSYHQPGYSASSNSSRYGRDQAYRNNVNPDHLAGRVHKKPHSGHAPVYDVFDHPAAYNGVRPVSHGFVMQPSYQPYKIRGHTSGMSQEYQMHQNYQMSHSHQIRPDYQMPHGYHPMVDSQVAASHRVPMGFPVHVKNSSNHVLQVSRDNPFQGPPPQVDGRMNYPSRPPQSHPYAEMPTEKTASRHYNTMPANKSERKTIADLYTVLDAPKKPPLWQHPNSQIPQNVADPSKYRKSN